MAISNCPKVKYDAIIIGGGISSLICGSYLASAGLKILIVEKNKKCGGYCSAFTRDGFTFDSAVHSFGNCSRNGVLRNILEELRVNDSGIIRADPADVVISNDYEILIKNDTKETLHMFQDNFPHEAAQIRSFFDLINESSFLSLYYHLKSKTFNELLNQYFKDYKLKSIFSIFLGNIGVSPSKVSALSAVIFLKEFVFNGGYYPKGGMQLFSDEIVKSFINKGGEILLEQLVEKIIIRNGTAMGITLRGGSRFFSKIVISGVDMQESILMLIGSRDLNSNFKARFNKIISSSSAFIVYLALESSFRKDLKYKALGTWMMPAGYDVEKVFLGPIKNINVQSGFVFCAF